MEQENQNQCTHQDRELFACILEDDEQIIEVYRPVRKTVRNSYFYFMMIIPIFGWIGLIFSWPILYPIFRLFMSKRAYAVTNKRIIVRGGLIGVDYKCLEYKSINASVVKVGVIDKVSKTNTGSLEFGSPANPIGMRDSSGMKFNPFEFLYIENPYQIHKKVKQIISKATSNCKADDVPGID